MRPSLVLNFFLALECIGGFHNLPWLGAIYHINSIAKVCCRLHQEPVKRPTKSNVSSTLDSFTGCTVANSRV